MDTQQIKELIELMVEHDLNRIEIEEGETHILLKRGQPVVHAAPAPAVAEIARVLRPGGLALVTTPNCGSLFWVLIENTWHRFFGGPCKPYSRDVHPSRFTRRSLQELLGQWLDVESVDTVWFGLILTAAGRKRGGD